MKTTGAVWIAIGLVAMADGKPPSYGPFPPSSLRTSTGEALAPAKFLSGDECGACHSGHLKAWDGSAHSAAHRDGIYLAFAEMARKEGGDSLYVFCSSCHAPGAVATREIPKTGDRKESFLSREGVSCDICHSAAKVEAVHQGAGANASLVLDGSGVRFGPIEKAESNDVHISAFAADHTKSVFCSACHTLVHPSNGLVIENTYEEWRHGPYAKAGIECQDCHMRTVSNALEVARTLKPVRTPGKAVDDGPDRPDIHEHMFVGGNTLGTDIDMGADHAAAARARLRSAATLEVSAKRAGSSLEISVVASNAAAGHAIPSSITELRQVWLDVAVTDAGGREVFRSGAIDETGKVDPGAVMYHAVLADSDGRPTYLPWRAQKMISEKLIPPRSAVVESFRVPVPEGVRAPFGIRATLRYRSAPQDVMDSLFGKGRFHIPVVDMAEARCDLAAEP